MTIERALQLALAHWGIHHLLPPHIDAYRRHQFTVGVHHEILSPSVLALNSLTNIEMM